MLCVQKLCLKTISSKLHRYKKPRAKKPRAKKHSTKKHRSTQTIERSVHAAMLMAIPLFALSLPLASRAQETTDLTNTVLTDRTADCAAYTGSYHSTVEDHVNNQRVNGQLIIESDSDRCTFQINQIPNHDFGQNVRWPHKPAQNVETIAIPRQPAPADKPVPLGLGPAAIMLNGVKWEPNPAACFAVGRDAPGRERIGCGPSLNDHPWRYNIGSQLNNFSFDDYHAHVQKGGMYHYHSTPRVLYTKNAQLLDDSDCAVSGPSPVIGFALDGYPVFGPCLKDESGVVRSARSSYVLKTGARDDIEGYKTPYIVGDVASADYNGQFVGDFEYVKGAGDLDECNGATIDDQYGYYATNEFPYALRCLTGIPLMRVR